MPETPILIPIQSESRLSRSLLQALMDFSEEEIEKIHIAAHLLDIGKIGVPDSVLNKEGRLTKEEIIHLQSHSLIGYNILHKIDIFKEIEVIVLHHHERYDGQGYPNNKKKDNPDRVSYYRGR